jgi:hypothetical protein
MLLMRAALGLLAIFFAHYLGRSAVGLSQRREPRFRTITWGLRAAVCVLAVLWRNGLDVLSVMVIVLVLISLAAGVRAQFRLPKDEHLVEKMFPKE